MDIVNTIFGFPWWAFLIAAVLLVVVLFKMLPWVEDKPLRLVALVLPAALFLVCAMTLFAKITAHSS